MLSLIIDTSSPDVLLALIQDTVLIDQMVYPHANQLSEMLLPSIQKLLEKNELKINAIDRVIAGMGPGSYTGTRVGVAVAKALAFGRKIPFSGFCSLLCFMPQEEGVFALVLPSKFGQFYLVKGTQTAISTSALFGAKDLAEQMQDVMFLGCNATQLLPDSLQHLNFSPLAPNCAAVARYLSAAPLLLNEKSPLLYLHASP